MGNSSFKVGEKCFYQEPLHGGWYPAEIKRVDKETQQVDIVWGKNQYLYTKITDINKLRRHYKPRYIFPLSLNNIKVGDYYDVCNSDEIWYEARVEEIKGSHFLVAFSGFKSQKEWIHDLSRITLQHHYTDATFVSQCIKNLEKYLELEHQEQKRREEKNHERKRTFQEKGNPFVVARHGEEMFVRTGVHGGKWMRCFLQYLDHWPLVNPPPYLHLNILGTTEYIDVYNSKDVRWDFLPPHPKLNADTICVGNSYDIFLESKNNREWVAAQVMDIIYPLKVHEVEQNGEDNQENYNDRKQQNYSDIKEDNKNMKEKEEEEILYEIYIYGENKKRKEFFTADKFAPMFYYTDKQKVDLFSHKRDIINTFRSLVSAPFQSSAALEFFIEQKFESDIELLSYTYPETGWTSLHLVARYGNLDLCSRILRIRRDLISSTDNCERLPIHIACIHKQFQIVKLLIQNNPSSMDIPDNEERTAIDIAFEQSNQSEIAQYLLEWKLQEHKHRVLFRVGDECDFFCSTDKKWKSGRISSKNLSTYCIMYDNGKVERITAENRIIHMATKHYYTKNPIFQEFQPLTSIPLQTSTNEHKKVISIENEKDVYCCICLTEYKDHLIFPCLHLCICSKCNTVLTCPLCNTKIKEIVKVFL